MASLFVTDLHPNVSEATLHEKFSSIGPLLSLRVCREAGTGRHLGYAYVNFVEQIHADRAIETMNFDLLEGKPIRIMRSERNRLMRQSVEPNVFIKNLDESITNRELFRVFSRFGKVVTCKVTHDQNGVSKCYGFVQMEDDEAAIRSIAELNGLVVNNKMLRVERFTKTRTIGKSIAANQCFTNVYVKNFDKDFNEEKLKEMFEKFGVIVSHKIMTEPDGTSRGFGFVSFQNAEDAFNATLQLNGQILSNGKALYVGRAQTRKEKELQISTRQEELNRCQKCNLCVSNLDDTIDDNRLRKLFQQYGTVTSAKVLIDESRSTGVAYVCFSRSHEAMKAIAAMNGRIVGNKPIIVSIAETGVESSVRLSFGQRRILDIRESVSSPSHPIPSHFNLPGVESISLQVNKVVNATESLVGKQRLRK